MQLPDYHEIIEHPMDFGTVRKKLDKGRYSYLEEFEVGYGLYSLIHWMFAVCCGCDTAFCIARNIAVELLYGLNAGFYCSCDNDHFFRAQKYGFGFFYAY